MAAFFAALFAAKIIEYTASILKMQPIVTYKNIDSTVTDRVFDISKAKKEIGYRQKTTLENGIKETIYWYKKERFI